MQLKSSCHTDFPVRNQACVLRHRCPYWRAASPAASQRGVSFLSAMRQRKFDQSNCSTTEPKGSGLSENLSRRQMTSQSGRCIIDCCYCALFLLINPSILSDFPFDVNLNKIVFIKAPILPDGVDLTSTKRSKQYIRWNYFLEDQYSLSIYSSWVVCVGLTQNCLLPNLLARLAHKPGAQIFNKLGGG